MIENIMTLQEHTFVFGTQMPFWNYTLPEGIALKVNSDYGLDINPHYFNYTNETIQGEVYLNFHTVLPQDVQIEAGIMQLNNNDLALPPNQETTITKIFSANDSKYLLALPTTILGSYITNGKLKSLDTKQDGNDT